MNDRAGAGDVGTANLRFARALIDALHIAGASRAYVCPGSRSTPLALAIAERADLAHEVHVDERSAAFHALGHAKATGQPALLVCTSGTAGANFLPAIAEAHQARVPVIVLTADRPPEVRDWGAPQTMEQRHLYAGFTRWSEETPCPSERPAEMHYARALGRRAVVEAMGPAPGPVHLNLPFREPLLPVSIAGRELVAEPEDAILPAIEARPADADALLRDLRDVERGVLVFGPDAWDPLLAASVQAAAEALGWPVLADPASGLRAGSPPAAVLMQGADLMLRDPRVADGLQPELIVRFGGQSTSAAIASWMNRHAAAPVWLVDPAAGFRDPQHRALRTYRLGARQFCGVAARTTPTSGTSDWLRRWQRAERIARAAADDAIESDPRFLTPHLARELWRRLPGGAALFAANSMVIRDLDAFAGPRAASLRLLANRGVNGIDGTLSSALGAARALGVPMVLWCGDLALLHDVAGLVAGRMHGADLTVVVSNDDGGGIFEHLPAARTLAREVFEEMFAVPHGLDLCEVASGLGWQAARAADAAAFGGALERALQGGRHLIEIRVDRAANTTFHADIHAAVAARLTREWSP
jgi:2-succinyl-5-enolpyruvyl-6-hydroxy-3-cyclohexene-1-carboxylate synthase